MPRGRDVYDEVRVQGRLWTPHAIRQQLACWLDVVDISTLTMDGSGNCSQIIDKSGRGRNATQSTAGSRPTYSSVNKWLDFDGTNDFFDIDLSLAPAQHTILTLARSKSDVTKYDSIVRQQSANYIVHGYYNSPNNRIYITSFDGADLQYSSSSTTYSPASETWYMLHSSVASGRQRFTINGTQLGAVRSNSISGTSTEKIQIGRYNGTAEWGSFQLSDVIILSSSADDRTMNCLEGYVAWKRGLQAVILPASHPYRNRPPLIGD